MDYSAHHICIQTNQYEASKQFYLALGFSLVLETPNFHGRSYNTWLKLNHFYIELQTGKETLDIANSQTEGIQHFCLYTNNLETVIDSLSDYSTSFIRKNGTIIYHVENGELLKIKAPEGTIIEFRNNCGV